MAKKTVLILLAILSIILILTPVASSSADSKKNILVVVQEKNESRNVNQLQYLLTHFDAYSADFVKMEDYSFTKNRLRKYHKIIYLGLSYGPPDKRFISDVLSTKKSVLWVNKNLDFLQRDPRYRLSFRRASYNSTEYQRVYYKKTTLPKYNQRNIVVKIKNHKKVEVFASSLNVKDETIPYLVKEGRFSYVADNPLINAFDGSSHLVFADYLHDFLEVDHSENHTAIVRIEDVHPKSDLKKVRQIIDYLYFNRVRFAIAVVPVYKKSPTSRPVYGSKVEGFKKLLNYAHECGGTFVLHGYTHQLIGETAEDAEFWDMKKNIPLEAEKVHERAVAALKEMNKIGLHPTIWEAPHYKISAAGRKKINHLFEAYFEREGFISVPYSVKNIITKKKVIPENLGYFDNRGNVDLISEQMVQNALRNKVVRDSCSAFFFHPSLNIRLLAETVEGIKKQNIEFISVEEAIGKPRPAIKPPTVMENTVYKLSLATALIFNAGNIFILVSILFISYYLMIFGLSKRNKVLEPRYDPKKFFVFIIPALNEEKVILNTVMNLLKLRGDNYLIVVADDCSIDDTGKIIKSIKSKKVQLFSMPESNCQKGKGHVLNTIYKNIGQFYPVKRLERKNIIIGIIDADGKVDLNIKEAVTSYFDDSKTAGVQTGVKIINEKDNILTKWQDYEFRVFCYMFQSARGLIGSVGLGGNGQFIRLSALDTLKPVPWTKCLTEDLDIGIRLVLSGWKNAFCKNSFVWQQGLRHLRPLIKQRTRWFQGHITCWRHLGGLTISGLPLFTKMDIAYYLLAIALAFVIIPANYFALIYFIILALKPALLGVVINVYGYKFFAMTYALYFGAMPVFVYSYWKNSEKNLLSAFILSHVFLYVSVVWLLAAYLAVFRLITGKGNWAKTPRLELESRLDKT